MKRRFLLCIVWVVFCLGTVSCTRVEAEMPGYEEVSGLPLRSTLEAMGYQVNWQVEDNTVVAVKNEEKLVFTPGSSEVGVNGSFITLNSPVILTDGITYLPDDALITMGIVDNKTRLAFRINEQMDPDTNYVFSPFSLKAALAMTANGADGVSRDEIVKGLGYSDIDSLNRDMQRLIERYNGTGEIEMSAANSIWVNDKYPDFKTEFKNAMDTYFYAESNKTSIADYSDRTNKWIKEKSRGLQDIRLEASENFAMSLINTTYFKGLWVNEFEPENNYDDVFINADGSEGIVTYMQNTFNSGVYVDNEVSMVRLDYRDKDRNLSFYAAMAQPHTDLEEYIPMLENREIHLILPKFKGHSTIDMNDIVKGLGITSIFCENADLDNIFTETVNIHVSDILQDTVIDVNEKGMEAASTTVVSVEATSAITEPPTEIRFNKPFTYFVMDNDSGEILFMGRMANSEDMS